MTRHSPATRLATSKAIRRECEGLWDWNLVSNRIHFSPGWMSLVGCLDHEIGSAPEEWFQRVHPDDKEQLSREIDVTRGEGTCEFELRYRLRHKDGTYRWMCSRGLVVRNDDGEAIRLTGTQADVTVDTVTDPVTALPNQLLLVERLTQSIARARRHSTFHFALLLIDIGRPAGALSSSRPGGDRLLNGAARRLETSLRTKDAMADSRQSDLVARLEGDLFAVLLDGVSELHDATVVADRVLAELMNPLALSSGEVRLSPTVGIALSASGYMHPDEALRDAETALHRARVLGGSHWEVFDAEVLKSQQSALQLEAELEPALQRDEFTLVYQPIVSTESNDVIGFEALVRWQHPTLGMLSPLDFIPIAERTGSIVPLGRWILNEACAQLRTWQTTLPGRDELWVSVNLSGVQLREPDLVEQIEEALQRHQLAPRGLVLELTEGSAMENPVATTTLLMRLRAMGVRISLDDFGTGYSSLAYLRQFPVDALKIDQSFVRGLANDKDTAVIVTGIVAMAKELGLYVVAEGVETDGQRAALHSLQCESVQGYLIARPLDPQGASDFLVGGASAGTSPASDTNGNRIALPDNTAAAAWPAWLPTMGRELLVVASVVAVVLSAGVGTVFYRAHHDRPASAPQHTVALAAPATTPATNIEAKEPTGPLTAASTAPAPKPLPPVKPAVVPVTPVHTPAAAVPMRTTTVAAKSSESPSAPAVPNPATVPVAPAASTSTAPASSATKPPAVSTPSAPAMNSASTPVSSPPVVAAPPPTTNVASAETRSAPAAVAASTKPVTPAVTTPSSPAASATALMSFDVVHLHGIGKCRGHLAVTRSGITFVPDDKSDANHAVTLKYGEFIQSADDKTLRIQTTKKEYSFRLATEASKNPADLKIAGVSEAITHAAGRGTSLPPKSTRSTPSPAAPGAR
jgi:diguanylate cyclase (GGDEF)-like protein